MAVTADAGDHELIAAAQRGERAALDLFVRRHERWVRNVVYATVAHSSLVDDVVQQVWATVWEQIGTLVDPARWRSWLYVTARNAAIDAGVRMARERRRRVPLDAASPAIAGDADPAAAIGRTEQRHRVLDAIRGLPAIYREPFILRHVEDWSYAQIGEALNLPVDTVETRLVRARRLLRETLSDLVVDSKRQAK